VGCKKVGRVGDGIVWVGEGRGGEEAGLGGACARPPMLHTCGRAGQGKAGI